MGEVSSHSGGAGSAAVAAVVVVVVVVVGLGRAALIHKLDAGQNIKRRFDFFYFNFLRLVLNGRKVAPGRFVNLLFRQPTKN